MATSKREEAKVVSLMTWGRGRFLQHDAHEPPRAGAQGAERDPGQRSVVHATTTAAGLGTFRRSDRPTGDRVTHINAQVASRTLLVAVGAACACFAVLTACSSTPDRSPPLASAPVAPHAPTDTSLTPDAVFECMKFLPLPNYRPLDRSDLRRYWRCAWLLQQLRPDDAREVLGTCLDYGNKHQIDYSIVIRILLSMMFVDDGPKSFTLAADYWDSSQVELPYRRVDIRSLVWKDDLPYLYRDWNKGGNILALALYDQYRANLPVRDIHLFDRKGVRESVAP